MARRTPRQYFSWRPRRKEKTDEREGFWAVYIKGPLKKAWESIIVRGITYLLAAASIPLYINFFENPLINFPLKVEVLDERTGGPLEHAEIYVQDTRYRFETGPDGIGQETARVRKKREQVVLTCTAEGYVTQEKLIDVPETRAPRPELYTLFVLTPSDLR